MPHLEKIQDSFYRPSLLSALVRQGGVTGDLHKLNGETEEQVKEEGLKFRLDFVPQTWSPTSPKTHPSGPTWMRGQGEGSQGSSPKAV